MEPDPGNGGAEGGFDGAGLEAGGAAGPGDTGLGAIWLAGGIAGVAGRGVIGDVPTCVEVDGDGEEPDGGTVGEAGRGGAAGGT